jgi:hypothetical protein
MRRLAVLSLVVVAAALQATQVLEACGDKFLIVGRGVKFQRAYAAVYPANILLYTAVSSSKASVMRDTKFHNALKSAGHQVTLSESDAALKSAVKSGSFDLILTDISQVANLGAPADVSASKSIVLPVVVDKPTKDQVALCERLLPNCKLKGSSKATSFLEVIDDAMEVRVKAQRAEKKGK